MTETSDECNCVGPTLVKQEYIVTAASDGTQRRMNLCIFCREWYAKNQYGVSLGEYTESLSHPQEVDPRRSIYGVDY